MPKALGDFLVLEAVYDTNGCAVAIEDEELLKAQEQLAGAEGTFICPEGAACFAAAVKLKEQGWIKADEKVVLLNTGTGIKYPDTVSVKVPLMQPDEDIKQ